MLKEHAADEDFYSGIEDDESEAPSEVLSEMEADDETELIESLFDRAVLWKLGPLRISVDRSGQTVRVRAYLQVDKRQLTILQATMGGRIARVSGKGRLLVAKADVTLTLDLRRKRVDAAGVVQVWKFKWRKREFRAKILSW
jgi:hypothetical protein